MSKFHETKEIEIMNTKKVQFLVGKTIKQVRYLYESETPEWWSSRPIVIEFTDGTLLMPQSDDEGNDGGAMYYQSKDGTKIINTI